MTRASERHRAIARTLWVVLLLNLVVTAAKLATGYHVGALALLADGVHSFLDASSNVVGLVGITLASRPPDRDHPYGHQRFETLAAVVIGLLIGSSLIEILRRIVEGFFGAPEPPDVSWLPASIVFMTVVINLFISRFEARRGKQLNSSILEADAGHTLSDALAATAVLAGFAGTELGFVYADLVAAVVVALFIGKTAWSILTSNIAILADKARLNPERVHAVALSVKGVLGAHNIRSRGSPDAVQLDLHIHLKPSMPLTEAHEKTHDVQIALRAAFPELTDVIIHTEPADGREKDPSRLAPGR